MSEIKNDPSELYDEEFLKKKEEFFASVEKIEAASKYEIKENDGDSEELTDNFDEDDFLSDSGFRKEKKAKKSRREKKKKEMIDTPEPEYDIFELADKFGIEEDKQVRKPKVRKEKKKPQVKKAEVKAPPKPREPLKPFVPHTPVEEIKADVYVKDEELYKEQNVDIDELLKNLGIPTAEEIEMQQAEADEEAHGSEEDDVKVFAGKDEMEDISSVSDEKPDFDEDEDDNAEEDLSGTKHFTLPPKEFTDSPVDATRHFNLVEYAKSRAAAKDEEGRDKRINFTQHFRFLKSKESDESILEAVPTGKGKDSVMDSVRASEGEDIFTAVEKAQKKKKRKALNNRQTFISLREYEEKLTGRLSSGKLNLGFSLGALVLSFILTVLPSFYKEGGALEFLFSDGAIFYGIINILVFALACLIARKELVLGFNNIRYMSPDQNSVTVVLGIFVLIFNLIILFKGTSGVSGAIPYTVCFAFVTFIRFVGAYLDDRTALSGVKALSEKGEYEGIHYVSGKNDALAIAHGLSEKNVPTILYGSESRVDEGVREDKAPKKDEDRFYALSSAAVLLVGFVAGLILFLRNKDAVSFGTALVSCVCFCLPTMNEFVSSVFFYDTNARLSKNGAAANDIEALEIVSKAKAVSADAKELFTCEISSFRRVRGAAISKSDAAVFAGAALKAGGSMAGDCFTEFIEGLGIETPVAEDLQYEDKLGFSCWIAERRVLVGCRQMLVEHSIEAPTQTQEKAYAGKRNVMYVAVDGMLVASFLVRYRVVPSFRKLAARFNRTGLVLLVNSSEPCLDEVNCASKLSLDVASVKVLSQKAASLVDSYKNDSEKGKATSLICRKGDNSLLKLVVSSHELYQGDRLISNLLLSGQGVALVLVLLSVILNMPLFYNPLTILVLQILWSFMSFAVASADFRKLVKRKIGLLLAKGRKNK